MSSRSAIFSSVIVSSPVRLQVFQPDLTPRCAMTTPSSATGGGLRYMRSSARRLRPANSTTPPDVTSRSQGGHLLPPRNETPTDRDRGTAATALNEAFSWNYQVDPGFVGANSLLDFGHFRILRGADVSLRHKTTPNLPAR